ncbi:DNA-3-methyladenine glycosylase [Georgenia sp. 10Sc9-8]|uniref:Putative 3-methyladenine DNA glycosylase n=1 Tax=Georgenia halotolerans TaxID=3028317 RepID=A0ABT5TYW0_9MICO|nr:DNA-3-methyladenine glycosylase [Georgenia halotolerans]
MDAVTLREALSGHALDVAPRLLGGRLSVRGHDGALVTVRLTEVEAYEGERDPGSHAYRGRTPRTATMFGSAGRLYVYFTYGMHWCANVVCGPEGTSSAVLLRGAEVVDGLDTARARRRAARRDADLARGPARLTQALGLDGQDDGLVLDPAGRAWLELPTEPVGPVTTGPRVGVAGPGGDAEAFPWRFWLSGERTVSDYRPAAARRRGRSGATPGTGGGRRGGAPPDQ